MPSVIIRHYAATNLVELCLRLSQPNLVFHHLSLHLLVVGLQRADQVAHLPVDGACDTEKEKQP